MLYLCSPPFYLMDKFGSFIMTIHEFDVELIVYVFVPFLHDLNSSTITVLHRFDDLGNSF